MSESMGDFWVRKVIEFKRDGGTCPVCQHSTTPAAVTDRCVTNLSQQDYDNIVRDAMLWRKQAMQPAPSSEARERFPLAAGQAKHDGWTVDYAYLCKVQDAIPPSEEGSVSLEDIEQVLLAERTLAKVVQPRKNWPSTWGASETLPVLPKKESK